MLYSNAILLCCHFGESNKAIEFAFLTVRMKVLGLHKRWESPDTDTKQSVSAFKFHKVPRHLRKRLHSGGEGVGILPEVQSYDSDVAAFTPEGENKSEKVHIHQMPDLCKDVLGCFLKHHFRT